MNNKEKKMMIISKLIENFFDLKIEFVNSVEKINNTFRAFYSHMFSL